MMSLVIERLKPDEIEPNAHQSDAYESGANESCEYENGVYEHGVYEHGAFELSSLAGWNQTADDWRRLVDLSPEGCFKAVQEGRIVGSVTTTPLGNRVAWIGMMLVHPEFRRRGIARALMLRAIELLRNRGFATIGLDATPLGKPLYEQLGFRTAWGWSRWRNELPSIAGAGLSTRTAFGRGDRLTDELLAIDRSAVGFDRGEILRSLAQASSVVISDEGFAMLRPGRVASQLGPVVAKTATAARELIDRIGVGSMRPGSVIWDVPGNHPEAIAIARSLGFVPFRELDRMWLGDPLPEGQPGWVHAIADPAIG
jgi:GNAT superfamily N-acetyltransferase